ncbi:MAG TPA: hypothetical protein VEX39_06875 [Thermoleophilaceae bacterium]|nr:hypothetical protein [Thermoleophilaceae bacterium]
MDRQSTQRSILTPDVTGRQVAAAGFGFALSLPLAATAFAMPACACGGGGSTATAPKPEPKPSPAARPEPAPVSPRVAERTAAPPRPPAPAPTPVRRPEPEPAPPPAPVRRRPQLEEPQVVEPRVVEPRPEPTPEPPPRPQIYGVDSITYHHQPPEDQQAIREAYEARHAPEPAREPRPEPRPEPEPESTPVAEREATPEPPRRPQVFGMDSFTYHHLPPEDQRSIRDTWNEQHGIEPDTPPRIGFQPQPAHEGPVLAEGERPVGAPFPGSLSVTCSQSSASAIEKGPCGMPIPGAPAKPPDPEKKGTPFSVEVSVTETGSRSDPVLDENGTRMTSMDMTTDTRVTGKAEADGKKVDLSLSGYLGESSTYRLTTQSSRADDIADGDVPAPTPADPRSLRYGEGIQLREEDYRGVEGSASYNALQVGLDYKEGDRVSAGVQRVDANTTRIYLGDEETVTNALKLGIGNDDLGVALSFSNEFADGKLRSVDLDVSTKEGWEAYQQFVNEGRLPAVETSDTPGVEDAAEADKVSWSGGGKFEAKGGPIKIELGGTSVEGNVTESHHTDGSVDNTMTARNGDVTLQESQTTEADGTEEPGEYSLNLQGVDKNYVSTLNQINGGGDDVPDEDQDVRLDFTESELEELRQEALRRIQHAEGQEGDEPTISEIEERVKGDPYAQAYTGAGPADDSLIRSIAAAEYPREVLLALYVQANGNSTSVADFLVRHHLSMGDVDGDDPLEDDAPGSVRVFGPGT